MKLEFSTYRYNPDTDDAPYMQDHTLEAEEGYDMMLLDALVQLKEKDPSLLSRRPCREGACGSDGLNMSGEDSLVYITPISALNQPDEKIVIHPLPGPPIIRDLVVDMGQFYAQYGKIKSYLLNNGQNPPARERLQMPEQREKFDDLYEYVLCTCYSASCPSFWWNSDKFIGPAGLLAVYRFLIDSRNTETSKRLESLSDAFSILRCHSVMNCVSVRPRGPSPTCAVGHIRPMLLQRSA